MYNNFFRAREIVSFERGDVNGDKIPDNVFLTGIKTQGSEFVQNITLVIQDGVTGRFTSIPLKENAGYNPILFLGDFTGDSVDDILVSINSGGSGGIMYYYIYSFISNAEKLLFDVDVYNNEYMYDVIYRNNYKVEVISRRNMEKYLIDISLKDKEYLDEIYDKDGKLKKPIEGFVNPLSGLYPIDFDGNGVYELLAYQKIAGRYNADSLGYVLNTLMWNNNAFTLRTQNIAIYGATFAE